MLGWSARLQALGCVQCRSSAVVLAGLLALTLLLMAATQGPQEAVPDAMAQTAEEVTVHTGTLTMAKTGGSVFYQYASGRGAGGLCVLLLHGAKFSSQTWRDLGTLSVLANAGHTAVAVDLPGYGKSPSHEKVSRKHFIADVMEDLQNEVPALSCLAAGAAVVSPSMSGSYSLPALVAGEPKMVALVAVAPVASELVTAEAAAGLKIPVFSVRGSRDTSLGAAAETALSRVPGVRSLVLEGAGHPAYLDRPVLWHRELLAFLAEVQAGRT